MDWTLFQDELGLWHGTYRTNSLRLSKSSAWQGNYIPVLTCVTRGHRALWIRTRLPGKNSSLYALVTMFGEFLTLESVSGSAYQILSDRNHAGTHLNSNCIRGAICFRWCAVIIHYEISRQRLGDLRGRRSRGGVTLSYKLISSFPKDLVYDWMKTFSSFLKVQSLSLKGLYDSFRPLTFANASSPFKSIQTCRMLFENVVLNSWFFFQLMTPCPKHMPNTLEKYLPLGSIHLLVSRLLYNRLRNRVTA